MTTIKATCPTCGDVDLTPEQLTLTVAPELGWAQYGFICPTCAAVVRKPADDEVVSLLSGAGVRVEHLPVPLELVERQATVNEAASISTDETLDFALWLSTVDDIVAAADEGR
jgi:hypothetical protein